MSVPPRWYDRPRARRDRGPQDLAARFNFRSRPRREERVRAERLDRARALVPALLAATTEQEARDILAGANVGTSRAAAMRQAWRDGTLSTETVR